MKIIETAIYDLLQSEPYYAHFLLNSRLDYNPKGLETAGFGIVNAAPVFCFNTDFLEKHNRQQIVAIMKHEVLHMLLCHAPQQDRAQSKYAKLWNIAADCAINQHIQNLPEEAITLASLSKLSKKQLIPLESAEYYYNELYQAAEKIEVSGMDTLDDHEYTVEGDEKNAEVRRLVAKNLSDKARNACAGNVPNSLHGVLGELNKEAKLPWKQMLRNFVATSTTSQRLHTAKKAHRRLGLGHPGCKKKRVLTLGVCVDSSGSVSYASFMEFFDEIKEIAKNNTVYLIDADAAVHNVQKIKAGSKVKAERHGNGGTAYQPAISKCVELKCSAILYFGDFDCSDTPNNPGMPFLWVGIGNQPPPAPFGKVVRL